MALWLRVILVLGLQGCCLAVDKNDTGLSIQESPQLKSTTTSIPHASVHVLTGESGHEADTTQEISTTSKNPTSLSNSSNGVEHTTSVSPTTTILFHKTFATTTKSSIVPTTKKDKLTALKPEHWDDKTKSPISIPTVSTVNLNSQKPLVSTTAFRITTENSSNAMIVEPKATSLKAGPVDSNGTEIIQTNTYLPEEHTSTEGTLEETTAFTSTMTENEVELETSTSTETPTDEETSTPEFTESENWYYSETSESATDSASDDGLFYSTTEFSGDPTTETVTEVEDMTTERPSIPNGIAIHESLPVRGISSQLTKLILRLSKPGVFEKGKTVFEDDVSTMTTSCPPGDVGLPCRRAEARRTADECSGGNCEVCRSCNNMAATDWPHCCRENFRCCSELALACQQCDQPTLQVFCTKHFKRCF